MVGSHTGKVKLSFQQQTTPIQGRVDIIMAIAQITKKFTGDADMENLC